MASAALMLVILWQRSPFLSGARRAAARDRPLSALDLPCAARDAAGAHRPAHRSATTATSTSGSSASSPREETGLSAQPLPRGHRRLQGINDRFGHPAGDSVLASSPRLRQGGEAFRLGGDEFASCCRAATRSERARAPSRSSSGSRRRPPAAGPVTVSAGIAPPAEDVGRDELVRRADSALYWAKEYGKNQTRVYRPDVVEIAELRRLAAGPDRAARFRAAASLAKAVDARDVYTGSPLGARRRSRRADRDPLGVTASRSS